VADQAPLDPGKRFAGIFKTLMLFCALVWLWGMLLLQFWPWHKGGEWVADFPIAALCANDAVCALPYGELAAARAAGKFKTLALPGDSGETAYQLIALQWKKQGSLIEAKASAWNFQTTVRYRIEDEQPVLVEYQEISGKLFLFALGGALLTLLGLHVSKRRRN
jgi:hypothetical protein